MTGQVRHAGARVEDHRQSAGALDRVRERFTLTAMLHRYEDLYMNGATSPGAAAAARARGRSQ